MLNARLILRLLKRLCQVLATLITSSAQRLRILVIYFRHFVAKLNLKIRGFSRHNTNSTKSSPADCCTVPTSTSGVRCPPVNLPLPLHNQQITSASPASSTQNALLSSVPMPVPCIPQQPIPPQTSSPLQVPNANPSSATATTPMLVPFAANDISRYDNRPFVDTAKKRDVIPALMRQFPNESCPWLSGDWKSCVHPEGVLYLYNERRSVFTEATMDRSMFELLDKCVDELNELAKTKSVDLGADDIELVVQLAQTETGDAQVFCYYYFIDHKARTLFWLHDYNQATDDIFSGLRGVADPSHIGYSLEAEYWTHCESYPDHQMDRPKIIKELRELVMHASAEIITSDTSLSPFDGDELSKILELINHLKENDLDNDPHSTCVIARFMHYFYRAKFFNFCGLPYARLEADKSVYEEDQNFHPLTSSVSFALDAMLFWAPQSHLEDLQKVWVDECINTPRWKDFNKNLMTEWTGITIYSTVMLAVDVSFLAVPNVNISQSQSIGIIVTYLSIIFITGSLIVSVLLVRQNQRYGFEPADKATHFLSHMTGTFFGMRALATVHGLPYAMLMWGMIYFAIAILYNVFKFTTVPMLASVVSGCVIITMFIFWFIWAAREFRLFPRLAKSIFPSVLARP
ncbi:hypothetical protein DFJ58DRAFT_813794 [Suillus subalutaceus]|uniref:uncharacterized protein n=1 Tax=Suillus subalutaceus TaxID=48586 RepID=UPI001B8610C8|nr:uncharacterized protein DFJ58DRAFT_813794 [Suillus subalutaceus]KAG1838586.1 hypothetical protein DFJ58DRAFT_813794 [Suillus subalutaceus]